MRYYSLRHQAPSVDFRQATIAGQAPDGGLYFPEHIPQFAAAFLRELKTKPKADVAFEVLQPYVGDTIPADVLRRICAEAVDFEFPLVPVAERSSALELFHGPTLAFKDVGARFMSRCLGYFSRQGQAHVTVLVATSGDTGGAVASGFLGVEGVEVIILYPKGKVSSVQELQLTTLGQNITALEVAGTFDDCQQLVKQAFQDAELARRYFLTSANSINVARWLPQQVYYCFALQQWPHAEPPVIAVPSGNFGNLCAGLLAHASGLPVHHFLAACNANDSVPEYLRSGNFAAKAAVATLSNAMDVGNPSNFVRILELFGQEFEQLTNHLSGYTVTDAETAATIRAVYAQHNYLLDPHGAVAYVALQQYLQAHPAARGIFLETAHPVKFYDVVEPVVGAKVPVPAALGGLLARQKQSVELPAEFAALKAYLLGR
ncbi:threonine synthase [Hymenobacter daecheongensis DSM 21074]|uniref:Threonine synthase n=1 Tax=Hymenobacter daecheongensis DSM 21074 TaxID=1121955 RepID=A0A1M6AW72_9BACT|nr:threonine synthase [Hymenobacter daecheongensis]SHI40702.1 threonine synthase [Hymenobacter daecheongensis DSM 21074]